MKKMLFAMLLLASTFAYATDPVVDEKIEKNFHAAFPKAEKVTWYENGTQHEVSFINESVKCRMLYDKEGNVLKTERYYAAENLPPFITAKLNKKYADKTVFGVTEITINEGTTYHIVLQDSKQWYFVTADNNGFLTFDRKMRKA